MKDLGRRIAALETKTPSTTGGIDLDKLTSQDLERLEAIVVARDAGRDIAAMPADDQRFIVGLYANSGD